MKKLVLTITLSLVTAVAFCQGLGFKTDFKSGYTSVTVATKVRTLDNFLSLGVNPDVLLFAGTQIKENGDLEGGGILAFNFKVSGGEKPINAYIGPFLNFAWDDVQKKTNVNYGVAFGIKF